MRYTADMGCAEQLSTLTKQPGAVRSSRRWVMGWSPEQIANRLPVQFPEDSSMRISHEAVHQALSSKDVARSSASWSPACAPAGAVCVPRARARQRA